MNWNDLTERQKELDRAIGQCGIKLDDSTTCLSKVIRAIGANPTEASFVKARINLRLKTQMALERADDLISKTEAMLDQFEKDDEEWRRKGRSLGFKF
ncbi:MAG: hypothetical protein ACI37N_11400 [Prevotella sp.]